MKSMRKIMECKTIKAKDFIMPTELVLDNSVGVDFSTPMSSNANSVIEMNIDGTINKKLLEQLVYGSCLGTDITDKVFTIEYQHSFNKQKRTNKKKRINKKWAKRYGYNVILTKGELKECHMKSDQENIIIFENQY